MHSNKYKITTTQLVVPKHPRKINPSYGLAKGHVVRAGELEPLSRKRGKFGGCIPDENAFKQRERQKRLYKLYTVCMPTDGV